MSGLLLHPLYNCVIIYFYLFLPDPAGSFLWPQWSRRMPLGRLHSQGCCPGPEGHDNPRSRLRAPQRFGCHPSLRLQCGFDTLSLKTHKLYTSNFDCFQTSWWGKAGVSHKCVATLPHFGKREPLQNVCKIAQHRFLFFVPFLQDSHSSHNFTCPTYGVVVCSRQAEAGVCNVSRRRKCFDKCQPELTIDNFGVNAELPTLT